MRAIVTGQVGVDKKSYLEGVTQHAGEVGENIQLYHVGDLMYQEAPDVKSGRILDLPLSRLATLRRAAFKDIIRDCVETESEKNIIVNTHATFRWRHGLFPAFDFDQIEALKPDIILCLVDNIEVVYQRLHEQYHSDATLKDLMVWREEEIMATELLAQGLGLRNDFYVISRGRHEDTIDCCFGLICRKGMKKVYPSFPMTHVVNMPEVCAEIDRFRAKLAQHFITFDPGDVDEKLLLEKAIQATVDGHDFIEATGRYKKEMTSEESFDVSVRQVLDIAGDIDGQIYARDFKLIDQSDMIVSFIPELPGGIPGLSSGVERELQHAFEHGKEVYVIWQPKKNPSPFITETSTRWFRTIDEAMAHFESKAMFTGRNLFGH